MLQSIEELNKEVSIGQVINGVDNAGLLSVSSITPLTTGADALEEKVEGKEEESKEVEAKEKAVEVPSETKEEQSLAPKKEEEDKQETKKEEPSTSDSTDQKVSAVKRIGDLTKKWRATERSLSFERQKREEAEAELKKLQALIPAEAPPSKDDFEDDASYQIALAQWAAKEQVRILQNDSTKQKESELVATTASDIEQAMDAITEAGLSKYEDFAMVALSTDLVITPTMVEVIILSDVAEDILYYLGQHPDESALIGSMSALKAAKEIGKIEVEVQKKVSEPPQEERETIPASTSVNPTVVPEKKLTTAPDPISPVRVTGTTEKDPSQMTPKEYRAWREQGK